MAEERPGVQAGTQERYAAFGKPHGDHSRRTGSIAMELRPLEIELDES
jgi:hypothetical protein